MLRACFRFRFVTTFALRDRRRQVDRDCLNFGLVRNQSAPGVHVSKHTLELDRIRPATQGLYKSK
jgi:hypothetical protein